MIVDPATALRYEVNRGERRIAGWLTWAAGVGVTGRRRNMRFADLAAMSQILKTRQVIAVTCGTYQHSTVAIR